MKNKKLRSVMTALLVLVMSMFCLTGCSQTVANNGNEVSGGGVLRLSVNPEIAVFYDVNGLVTKVESRNDDGQEILANYSEYKGKEARIVITDLVTAIGEAGYFVEDVDGNSRKITIELESGSKLPHDGFFNEVVSDIQNCVNKNEWHSPIIAIDNDIIDDVYDDINDPDDIYDDVNDPDDIYDDINDPDDVYDDVNDPDDIYDDINDPDDVYDDVNGPDDIYDDINDPDDVYDDINDPDDIYDDIDDPDDIYDDINDPDDVYDDVHDSFDDREDVSDDINDSDDISDDADDLIDD